MIMLIKSPSAAMLYISIHGMSLVISNYCVGTDDQYSINMHGNKQVVNGEYVYLDITCY